MKFIQMLDKKIVCLLVIMSVSYVCHAQYKGQYRIQSGNEYNFNAGLFGINFTGEAFPLEHVSVAPSFTFLLPATGKASNLHIDFRYYFTEEKVEFYSLLGYGLFRRRFEFTPEPTVTNINTINIGGGVIYKFYDELGVNIDLKFQPQNQGEFILKVGISYFIN